jgi:hypothetical protein
MLLYNVTDGVSGPITAVTAHTVTATGVTWDDGDAYRVVAIDVAERSTIELYLDIAASDIHAALAASGACDCNLASWAEGFLAKLNVIDAAAYYTCSCGSPKMTDDRKQNLLVWCSNQLEAIRDGRLELCDGQAGSEFPALRWAQQGWTDWNVAKIIYDEEAS